MTPRILRAAIGLAAVAQLSTGCAFRPVRLSSSEPGGYDLSRSRDISATACGFIVGGLIPIALSNRDQRAFNRLTEQAHGDSVADVEAEEHMTYAVVGWTICITFHAVAYPRL